MEPRGIRVQFGSPAQVRFPVTGSAGPRFHWIGAPGRHRLPRRYLVQAKFIIVVLLAAAAAIAAGCSRNEARDAQGVGLLAHNPLAPGQASLAAPDTIPHPGPPPRPPKQGLSLQFAGSDSVSAGQT